MAAKKQESNSKPKKRNRNPDANTNPDSSSSKKPKLVSSKPENKPVEKVFKPFKKTFGKVKSQSGEEKKTPLSKRERRIHAKELTEARKKRRKQHYTLEQELARLWEKMRQRNIAKEERSKIITEAIQKMKGKIPEIASSHVSSRVLQTCVKYCSQAERDAVFDELKPHFLTFASNKYAIHLVTKMLDNGSKKQLAEFISPLRGHVASLLRHTVGSVVIEHAYQLGNATQKQELLMELYSTELQLFKDLASMKESRLVDVISKLNLQKGSVSRYMASVIQPILEKGIVDHTIIHKVLIEYLSIADKTSAAEIIQQLSGPLLVRMIHTRDGSRIGILCVKHGSAKERKKIVKGLKGTVGKTAHFQYGSLVLACIVSTVDDTKLVAKTVIRELQTILKELVLDKNGRRPLLQLLNPNCTRYFSPDEMASLRLSISSLNAMGELEVNHETKSLKDKESSDKDNSGRDFTMAEADGSASSETLQLVEGGKKDPSIRRQELLVGSGLAKNLIDMCTENAEELLRSNFGKEVLYEAATGGSGGILQQTLGDKLNALHEAIASVAAESKSEGSEKEHVLENFHSSRTIRKLVLDNPTFAATLWKKALSGKCEQWAQGHSSKVICAFLESSDAMVSKLAREELQPLINRGILKLPEKKQPANEG
ncbi:PREDICTED: pumilio homolog 24-like isoform X2 [Populus euphratica]|uniref:Pumilio homolog 24-like isoform X2 n=1 Tax=Populus euphratica TaxID=75702 RepID=A0AAJ6XAN1_POPEU|nr:PREDICTED: pumilio homolog 24-like isoform X2 [Populus euphratica]